MSYPPHRMMPPVESRKRKERELFHYNKTTAVVTTTKPKPSTPLAPGAAMKGAEPAVNNRLLAGYLAYEFLRKGTLLGKMYNPVRAEVSGARASAARAELEPSMPKDHDQYGEVASILKIEGTHIPDIVNPTQLARWIQM